MPKIINENTSEGRKVTFLEKLAVGGTSGVVAVSIVYPLDIVKTTMQRQVKGVNMIYNTPWQAFKGIAKVNGRRGLYRGICANLLGVFPVQAIKLASNDLFREWLTDENGHISFLGGMIAGAGAGGCQVIAANPMEITKIRMQIQSTLPDGQRMSFVKIVQELGIKGIYKGSTITILRDIPYFMIFFPLNHALEELFKGKNEKCGIGGLLAAGCLAGMTSAFIMTPMDVIKTRVQAAKGVRMDIGFYKMFKTILKNEGVSALFKGATMRMSVQAPMFAIMMCSFEMQKRYIATINS